MYFYFSESSKYKVDKKSVQGVFYISFKDLSNVMLSGEPRRRRRVLSTDAVESLRLKNSRSGYLSKVTQLFRSIEELQQDTRNVDEVSEKIGARRSIRSLSKSSF